MKNNKIRVCVIDDETDVKNALIELVNSSIAMEVVCDAESVNEGFNVIVKNSPDLIFLDIKLLGGDAFAILDKLREINFSIPPVVINTGFKQFKDAKRTLNEFKDEVLIILEKPFFAEWKEKENLILKKYYRYLLKNDTRIKKDKIIINTRYKTFIIRVEDIINLEISKNGSGKTTVVTIDKEHEINKSLSYMENQLPNYFIRINRYEIINGRNIAEYDHSEQILYLYDIKRGFDVGNTYKDDLLNYIETL